MTELTNIGRGQRRWRLFFGIVSVCFAVVLAVFLVLSGVNRLWRFVLYLPLAVGVSALFEAQDKVCVVLANRGECSLDDRFYASKAIRGEKIQDASLVSQLRRQAKRITLKTQVVAIALTMLFVALPS